MKIIAHRGGPSGVLQDNSLEAIEYSLKLGVPFIEIDVREFGGKLYVVHDPPKAKPEAALLEDVLKLIAGKAELLIEIKESDSASKVFSQTKKHYKKHLDKVVFLSFEKEALEIIRKKDNSARLALNYRAVDTDFIDIAKRLGLEAIGMHRIRYKLNFFNIKQARSEIDCEFYAYTVNSRLRGKTLETLGADGIFTDYPKRFGYK